MSVVKASPVKSIAARVRQALTLNYTEDGLMKLALESKDLVAIKDKTDYHLVKTSIGKLRTTRVSIEKAGKAARDDANKFSKAVIAEQTRLVNIILTEEARLKELRQAVDDEEDRLKAIAANKEAERVEAIQNNVAAIYSLAEGLLNSPSSEIRDRLVMLGKVDFDSFEEFHAAAEFAVDTTRKSLEGGLIDRARMEEQQEEQARVAELQRIQQEKLDEQQRIVDDRINKQREAEEELERREYERQRVINEEAEPGIASTASLTWEKIKAAGKALEKEKTKAMEALAEEERQAKLLPAKEKLLQWAGEIKNIEPPTGIRSAAQKVIVENALRILGDLGNNIITQVNDL